VEQSGVAGRIHLHGPIADADVVALMKGASGFLFPSRYEGFGIPVLEAMACDCPVLCANTASLPEVAGNAALFYHPDDVDGFAEGMKRILDDQDLKLRLVKFGRERVLNFTWDRCAQGIISTYRELASPE
jgi:glycosyltransferase involved in cell wall biosynthesis